MRYLAILTVFSLAGCHDYFYRKTTAIVPLPTKETVIDGKVKEGRPTLPAESQK